MPVQLAVPLPGQIFNDRSIRRRLRVGDVDATHVIGEVDGAGEGEPFRRERTTRITIGHWQRRMELDVDPDPVAHWRDPAGDIQRITDQDHDILVAISEGRVHDDSRFPRYDYVEAPADRLPRWIVGRLFRLQLAVPGEQEPRGSYRPGGGVPYTSGTYRATVDGAYLLRSLAEDAPRCRVCGCTEDRACPGGCWWVPDPLMTELCSTCG